MEEKREKNYRLINMEDVQAREVSWLWYPYIPYGKLTIVQGDPGEGKTTFILHLAALGRYHKTTIVRSRSRL